MHIRRYESDDRQAVWELHNRALHDVGAHGGNGAWDDDLHAIEAEYLQAGGEFLVGVEGGRIVAMGALRRIDETTAEVTRMRVEPARQGQGLGRAMLEALEGRAAELGFTRLTLETTTKQLPARRLYESAGYTHIGQRPHGPFTVLAYEKHLT